jgi:hypothetical protein
MVATELSECSIHVDRRQSQKIGQDFLHQGKRKSQGGRVSGFYQSRVQFPKKCAKRS